MASEYVSLKAFYADRPERDKSPESDYGVHWHANGRDWPSYRVSYVQATGEVYAVERGAGPVRVLGVVQPDPDERFASKDEVGGIAWSDRHRRGTYYDTLDKILDGWADPGVSGFDLAWIERKLASYREG